VVAVQGGRLELRSQMLANAIVRRRDALAGSLAAPGDRVPFTERLPKGEALTWWRANREGPLGQEVLKRWQQADPTGAMIRIAELDRALAEMYDQEAAYGAPLMEEVAYGSPG
jgi:hypothetical protein